MEEIRIKHLEMIQAIISRMSGYCASQKNYCMTVVTAIFGFSITAKDPWLAALSIFPIILFASLDAKYLSQERDYIRLYNRVRRGDFDVEDKFNLDSQQLGVNSITGAIFSWSILGFYLPLIVAAIFVWGAPLIGVLKLEVN